MNYGTQHAIVMQTRGSYIYLARYRFQLWGYSRLVLQEIYISTNVIQIILMTRGRHKKRRGASKHLTRVSRPVWCDPLCTIHLYRVPIYQNGLTNIRAWISNDINFLWYFITYLIPNINALNLGHRWVIKSKVSRERNCLSMPLTSYWMRCKTVNLPDSNT